MKFVAYKSSAGSGKTHTLVREYLRLVISNPEKYKNILAITFTNKAANEMKGRILEYLDRLISYDASTAKALIKDLMEQLKAELNLDEAQIRYRAAIVLSLILHNYSNFAVSTIDSFTHRLVRSFARDLRLPLNFEIGLDTDQLINKSIDMLIGKVGSDETLTRILVQFVVSRLEDEQSWNIELELKKFGKILLREDSMMAVEKLRDLEAGDFIIIKNKLQGRIRQFENLLSNIGRQAMDLIDNHHLSAKSFYQSTKGIYSYIKRIAENDFSKVQPNSYVRTTITGDKWPAPKCPPDEKAAIDSISPQLQAYYQQIQDLVDKHYPDYKLFGLILKNIYPIAVLNEIDKVMAEFRENENTVHISEFNKRIAAIIDAEPVPFIYERVGEKYRHFLVDEFQDTSLLQWKNLLPLFENSLGSNQFNMIVGDAKQAIYRFRNGEVEQFAALPGIYGRGNDPVSVAREELLKKHYREVGLTVNYRSGGEIVRFNNRFFNYARQFLHDDLAGIYMDVAQQYIESGPDGMVHLEFTDQHEDDKNGSANQLNRILDLIRNDLAEFEHGDIAILTRTKKEGSEVARMLLENGINVVSSEVLRLDASPDVGFLTGLLRHLNAPDDMIPAAEVLVYLFEQKKLPFDHLHHLFSEVYGGTYNGLTDFLEKQGFHLKHPSGENLTLPELIGELIEIFGLDPQGQNPFMQFLLDLALNYNATENEGIAGFLEFWDEKGHKESIVVPETGDAVKIMTIHKAKGLQFPVVIYPFASAKPKKTYDEAWIEPQIDDIPELKSALVNLVKDIEETRFALLNEKESAKSFLDLLNVLYVALTRPEQRMYIFSTNKMKDGKWKANGGLPDVPDLLYNFLEQENLWEENNPVYIFGEAAAPSEKSRQAIPAVDTKPGAGYSSNWRQKVEFRRLAPRYWNVENPGRSRDRGILLHQMMAGIKTVNDLEKVFREAQIQGLIREDEKSALEEKMRRLIRHPKLERLFAESATAFTERDILLANGTVLRPDRMVTDGSRCTIIDYKTGHAAESHKKQMREYSQTLYEMGFQKVEALLVYLDEEEVVEVGPASDLSNG